MPSTYAHYRFGVQILPSLPADVRRTIQRNRALFDAGLQGPDPLFYYKPMTKNEVSPLARVNHHQSGRDFFTRVCSQMWKTPSEGGLAYLYGVLAHYCLDSLCHPLVHELTDEGPVSHNELESEFERYLLSLDGVKKPHGYDRAAHLKLKKAQCAVAASFYPPLTGEQFYQALAGMAQVLRLLSGRSALHHTLAEKVLYAMGEQYPGLLMHMEANPACAQYNDQLLSLYNAAVERFPEYLEQLRDHMTFNEPLGDEFAAVFG